MVELGVDFIQNRRKSLRGTHCIRALCYLVCYARSDSEETYHIRGSPWIAPVQIRFRRTAPVQEDMTAPAGTVPFGALSMVTTPLLEIAPAYPLESTLHRS